MITPENYLIYFSNIIQFTPEQFRDLAGLCEDLRRPDQPERNKYELDEMFVMRILFDIPKQETATRRLKVDF